MNTEAFNSTMSYGCITISLYIFAVFLILTMIFIYFWNKLQELMEFSESINLALHPERETPVDMLLIFAEEVVERGFDIVEFGDEFHNEDELIDFQEEQRIIQLGDEVNLMDMEHMDEIEYVDELNIEDGIHFPANVLLQIRENEPLLLQGHENFEEQSFEDVPIENELLLFDVAEGIYPNNFTKEDHNAVVETSEADVNANNLKLPDIYEEEEEIVCLNDANKTNFPSKDRHDHNEMTEVFKNDLRMLNIEVPDICTCESNT